MASTINGTSTGSGGLISTGDDSGILNIQTNETTAITVDASQRVGIGTTSPSVKLEINPPTLSGTIQEVFKITDSANSTLAIRQTTTVNDIYANNVLSLSTNGAERARIDSSGNWQVGGQYAVPPTTSYGRITSTGIFQSGRTGTGSQPMAEFFNGNSNVGSIYTSGSNTSYNTSSDYRLKENIAPMTGALAKVTQLKPVTYKWKVDGADGEGFIAHELAEVCPQAVHGTKDEVDADGNPQYQGIDVSFLVATLTAALQETKALIDTQAETINALTARIVALETA
jgi:hypothetical protein